MFQLSAALVTGRLYTITAGLYAALAFIAALWLAYIPVTSQEAHPSACVIGGLPQFTEGTIAAPGQQWSCQGSGAKDVSQTALVRFDIKQGSRPTVLRTRIGLFDEIQLFAVDHDGTVRTRIYSVDTVQPVASEPMFLIDLPEVTEQTRSVFMQTEGAGHDATPMRAVLFDADPTANSEHFRAMVMIALLVGLVLAPMVFDLAFFGALRSPFLLWHAILSLTFGVLVILRSGLIVEFVDISITTWRAALIMGLGFCIFSAAMFTRSFIEEDMLDPRLRRMLPFAGIWAVVLSAIHLAHFDFLQPLGGTFHSIGLAPVLVAFGLVLADAYRRGSRAVRFQILGWMPLMLGFAVQLVSYLAPLGLPTDALPMFYLGTLSETTITAIGVGDKFLSLRKELTAVRSEAEELEKLSERDPLTGLLNRRAIDSRFDQLHKSGYETFALLDLDNFKKINDTAGHDTGDKVLQVVAEALRGDDCTISIRLGGEEFVLLMRGDDAFERAERLRQMVSLRVARSLPELGQVVTASMGLIVAPRKALPKATFSDLYSRADMLLYEAKAQGRNRMMAERIQAFERRKAPDRRKSKAA